MLQMLNLEQNQVNMKNVITRVMQLWKLVGMEWLGCLSMTESFYRELKHLAENQSINIVLAKDKPMENQHNNLLWPFPIHNGERTAASLKILKARNNPADYEGTVVFSLESALYSKPKINTNEEEDAPLWVHNLSLT